MYLISPMLSRDGSPSNAQSSHGLPALSPSRLRVMAVAPMLVLAGPWQASAKCSSRASRAIAWAMSKWPQAVSMLDGPAACRVLNHATQS
ncbi:hypothetical protein [Pseudomonas sp. EA_65y_Pfl2_P78]|uniref:hypothetical protein n=1 Tax=Pseudomonas sp. EA_65y_Pfl2_P78 TaxID=3088695 RepID=UPI00403F108E